MLIGCVEFYRTFQRLHSKNQTLSVVAEVVEENTITGEGKELTRRFKEAKFKRQI